MDVEPSISTDGGPGRQKRALVTGASGYLGSEVVKSLIVEKWCVHAIIRPGSSTHLLHDHIRQVELHHHDGSIKTMMTIVDEIRPDVVFHLAAMTASDHQMKDVEPMIAANITFSTQLVEAMHRCGARYLVNTETFWQHSRGTDQYDPMCLYAATKQAFHDILKHYTNNTPMNAISLVLYDTYGIGDPRKKILNYLKQAVADKIDIEMTAGEQQIDMTHVKDVAAAYLHAAKLLMKGAVEGFEKFCVTSDNRVTLKELVQLIIQSTGFEIAPVWGARPYRQNEIMMPWPGKKLPGWRTKVSLAVGLREFFKSEA